MKTQLFMAFKVLLIMTILTGIIYPLVMTGLSQLSYPHKANGSLIMKDNKVIGSELLSQKSDSIIYFESRPSAIGYNPIPSGATNYGPTSDTLRKLANSRRALFAEINSIADSASVPKEMIFASASGLDPHISPESAIMQVDRIARERQFTNIQKDILLANIQQLTQGPHLLILGESRVNVLKLNLQLDKMEDIKTDKLGNNISNK